jgi:hypothetical protein
MGKRRISLRSFFTPKPAVKQPTTGVASNPYFSRRPHSLRAGPLTSPNSGNNNSSHQQRQRHCHAVAEKTWLSTTSVWRARKHEKLESVRVDGV